MGTVGTPQLKAGYCCRFLVKGVLADFTEDLSFGSIVLVEIDLGSVAPGAFTVVRNITLPTVVYRLYGLVIVLIAPFKVLHEVTVIPGLHMKYQRELIHFELLVLWRMGVIKSPLFERDVLADKVYQPYILLMELLN